MAKKKRTTLTPEEIARREEFRRQARARIAERMAIDVRLDAKQTKA